MDQRVKELNLDDEASTAACFEVITYLRPHLNQKDFVLRAREQAGQGYKIIYIEHDSKVAAVAGYRVASFLAWGKVLYIDDLVTHPDHTRLGLSGALLDRLIENGRQLKCDAVHLDTGHHRHDAHRLYLNKGFRITSHHMSIAL